MIQSIKNRLVMFIAILTLATPVIVPLPVGAATQCNNVGSAINTGINATSGSKVAATTCGASGSLTGGIGALAAKVVNVFSIIVGIVSVIMIIYAGFKYITSGGESGSVSGAKNTLIYAIVGLIIVVLAQLIVRYVLNYSSSISNAASAGQP